MFHGLARYLGLVHPEIISQKIFAILFFYCEKSKVFVVFFTEDMDFNLPLSFKKFNMLEINDRVLYFHQINKKWHWRLKNKQGDLISRSDSGFDSREDCETDARQSMPS